MRLYLQRIFAWLSQGFNCVVLLGSHDQTVSARAYLNRERTGWGQLYRAINAVFFWQDDHCFQSFLDDVDFAKEVLKHVR